LAGFKAGAGRASHILLETGTVELALWYSICKKPEDTELEQRKYGDLQDMQKQFWENRQLTWKKQG